jgi:hypothetical protein
MAEETDDEEGPLKRPSRGIRFTDVDYDRLRNSAMLAGHRHLGDFIMFLLDDRKKRPKAEKTLADHHDRIRAGIRSDLQVLNDEQLKKVRELLVEFTGGKS